MPIQHDGVGDARAFGNYTCVNCYRQPHALGELAGGKFVVCKKHQEEIIAKGVKQRETALVMASCTFSKLPSSSDWDTLGIRYGKHTAPVAKPSRRATADARTREGKYPD